MEVFFPQKATVSIIAYFFCSRGSSSFRFFFFSRRSCSSSTISVTRINSFFLVFFICSFVAAACFLTHLVYIPVQVNLLLFNFVSAKQCSSVAATVTHRGLLRPSVQTRTRCPATDQARWCCTAQAEGKGKCPPPHVENVSRVAPRADTFSVCVCFLIEPEQE